MAKQRRKGKHKKAGPKFHKKRPPHPGHDQSHQNVEPSVISGLHRRGCSMRLTPELDNVFKIDSLVEHIHGGPEKPAPIGLQITKSLGHFEKIRTFVHEASKWPGIGPLMYAEMHGPISRDSCVALRDALLDLWKDPARQAHKAWCVTVYTNGAILWRPI